jgi:hypothetical protein
MFDRGTDEVRSWFGDDEAEQRRRFDRRGEDRADGTSWSGRSSRRDWLDDDRDGYRTRGTDESRYEWEPSSTRRGTLSESYRASGADVRGPRGRNGGDGYLPSSWSYTEVWMIPGPYVGRGPTGYVRSDERIREDVCDRLTQHGRIDAGQVDVSVSNGEVTLRGHVPDRESKRLAEDVAESVFGVHDVRNELRTSNSSESLAGRQETTGERSLESPLGLSSAAAGGTSTSGKRTESPRQLEPS